MSDRPRVVVTRRAEQAQPFCQLLNEAGMVPILFPTITLKPLPAPELRQAIIDIEQFDWLIFSSANAVDIFFQQAGNALDLPQTAVVGSATARRLDKYDVRPDYMPDDFRGEALAAGLGDLRGRKVLLPRAKKGRPEIVNMLQSQGAQVVDIPIYDTDTAQPSPEKMQQVEEGYEVLTFASPSSMVGFLKIMNGVVDPSAVIACIGPVTANAAREAGLDVTLVPDVYTVQGLADSLRRYFRHVNQDMVYQKGS